MVFTGSVEMLPCFGKLRILASSLTSLRRSVRRRPFELPFSEIHRERVAQFESLYNLVTQEIEGFRDSLPNALAADDRQWLTALIFGFRKRYDEWIPQEIEYLKTLYDASGDTFTVCGLAALHIRYDLPVVIAATLRGGTENERLARADHYEQIYFALEKAFKNAMDKPWDKPWVVEFLQSPLLELEAAFLTWLLKMRSDAWFEAKKLARSTEAERASVEDQLHKDVQDRLDFALTTKGWLWAKIFALATPHPIFAWSGVLFIAASISGVAVLLPGWLSLIGYVLAPLPIVIKLAFRTIAFAQFKKMLASFLPPSLDPPDR